MRAGRDVRLAALAAVVVGACGALAAVPARAATASVAPSFGLQTLNYRAAPGEVNRLTVSAAGRAVALATRPG